VSKSGRYKALTAICLCLRLLSLGKPPDPLWARFARTILHSYGLRSKPTKANHELYQSDENTITNARKVRAKRARRSGGFPSKGGPHQRISVPIAAAWGTRTRNKSRFWGSKVDFNHNEQSEINFHYTSNLQGCRNTATIHLSALPLDQQILRPERSEQGGSGGYPHPGKIDFHPSEQSKQKASLSSTTKSTYKDATIVPESIVGQHFHQYRRSHILINYRPNVGEPRYGTRLTIFFVCRDPIHGGR
jgi:hypothetical protein